ncbi:MAG TPA: sugar ABC transporter permease [Chloroflexota bacterium]|nr:sugar ABC transporter permease [Chloroflexota bacterium]
MSVTRATPTYRTRRRSSPVRRREMFWGFAFLLPWLLGFILFQSGPMLASLGLSLTTYNIVKPPVFIGIQNYVQALTQDPLFWPSLGRTFYYAGITVPLGLSGSLLLAVLLNRALVGTSFYRTFFFLPHLTPIVATAILWKWLFEAQTGPINYLLDLIGIPGPGWLGDANWAIPSLMIMALWAGIGGNQMIIFLAGLQGIPSELHEAASIDGANLWQRFRHVTLPMLSPVVFFNLVLGVIGALKVFASAIVATNGGPAYATWFFAVDIYTEAFQYFHLGYAAALAWLFFVVMFAFTFIQFRSSARWVYYAGDREPQE